MTNSTNMITRVLRRKGTDDYLLRKVTSSGLIDVNDPSKGPTLSTVDHSMQSYPGSADMVRGFMFGQKTDTLIEKEDIFLIVDVASLSVTPDQADMVVKLTKVYNIKKVYSYEESGSVILYVLQIRL